MKYGLVSPEEKALEPFSRNNLPVYNSNFKIKVANKNRKVENSNWQYGPSVTIKIANTENEQFHQNGIDWEVKYDTVSNVDFIEVNVNTQNLLGKMYVTSPEPSNLSGILNQFTLDVSYNTWDNSQNITTSPITGTPWANSWQNVSSNVTPDEYSIKGSYQDSASNWVVNKLWDITETQLDYGNIVLRWPVLTYAGSGVTIRESNMWRWQLRLSYQPSSTSSDRIASGFERLTNGEYRYNVGSYKSELQTFSQVTASPVFDTVTSYSNEYDDTLNLINVGYSTQIKDAGATNGDERGPPIDLYQSNYNSPIENEQYIPWGHQAHFILWYPVDISGCIRGATSSTNTLNKNSLANKPTINVSSTMENENRFARIDKDEIRELTINGVDTCIQKAPMAQSKKNMMDLGRGFTCFVNTSANWLESDFDTIQLNNNYGTLLDHTIVSNHGISLSNPSNIFKWKPDFSGFLGDPTSSTTLPASAFNVMYIKDASGNYYNSGLISYSAPVQVGKRGYGGIEDDNFYTSNTISLTGMAAGKPYLKIQIEHDGYKLNPLDGYNADFDDFLKLTHKKNGNIVTAAAEWITTNQIAGLSNTQTLNFSNTESSTGTSYNGLHSTYKIINYIKLKPKGDPSTTAGTYDWSTLDVIEIELQDAANGTYNIRNKFTIGFS